jgi:transcriptional regulator with XRE-family HTH domain
MMANTLPEPIEIAAELVERYRQKKITLQELAKIHRASVATIWRRLKRQGVCQDSRRGRPTNSQTRKSVLTLAARGWSRRQIAEELMVTQEWVRSILAERGLSVSSQILKCQHCGEAIVAGHKSYQPKPNHHVLCLGCLKKRPGSPFSQRLKGVRLAQNLSVSELSAKCGLSRAAIGKYESGRAKPTLENARKLAATLRVDRLFLFGPSQG